MRATPVGRAHTRLGRLWWIRSFCGFQGCPRDAWWHTWDYRLVQYRHRH